MLHQESRLCPLPTHPTMIVLALPETAVLMVTLRIAIGRFRFHTFELA
jgi:hypothetical protein